MHDKCDVFCVSQAWLREKLHIVKHMTENASRECIRLSKRLKSIRQARGFKTARSFASKLEIHENRYTRYERAEVEPDLELLVKFCSILKITPNDLLSETIEMASEPASAAMEASGFTESNQTSFNSETAREPDDLTANRFAAEVMALSTLLAEISLKHQSAEAPTPADTMKMSGDLFKQIMDNPFSVLPDIGSRIPIHAADLNKQAQVAEQIQKILEHYRSRPIV